MREADAKDPGRSAHLPSSKSIMGLARIERAKSDGDAS